MTIVNPVLVRAAVVGWLAAVWMALWGDLTAGTGLAGVAVGWFVVRLVQGRTTPGDVRVDPVAALRFAGVFAWLLIVSTGNVVAHVLRPRLTIRPGVVAVVLPAAPPAVATLVANSVSLTPGTVSLDLDVNRDGTATLHVHTLDGTFDSVTADVLRFHRLATAAFGRPSPVPTTSGSAA